MRSKILTVSGDSFIFHIKKPLVYKANLGTEKCFC